MPPSVKFTKELKEVKPKLSNLGPGRYKLPKKRTTKKFKMGTLINVKKESFDLLGIYNI
jgi:carbohydrate-binding DOMON domain-containing protein